LALLSDGSADDAPSVRSTSGIHSVQRAFELLEAMADAGGRVGLSELAVRVDLPKQNPQRPHTDPALRANPLPANLS
jgi:hypothetical protein